MFLLRRVELFARLREEDLRRMAQHLTTRQVDAGAAIISEGGLDRDVFFLKSGSAEVRVGTRTLTSLTAGANFGELAAFDAAPRSSSVIAREPCVLYRLSAADMNLLVEGQEAIALGLIEYLCRLLRRLANTPAGKKG